MPRLRLSFTPSLLAEALLKAHLACAEPHRLLEGSMMRSMEDLLGIGRKRSNRYGKVVLQFLEVLEDYVYCNNACVLEVGYRHRRELAAG